MTSKRKTTPTLAKKSASRGKAAPKKVKAAPKKPGPPPVAQDKLEAIGIEAICTRIGECERLRTIAADVGVSLGVLSVWLSAHPEQYARAMEARADKFAEEILEIADDGRNDTYVTENGEATNHDVIARSRLRVDARKWLAAKMAPKKYGEKVAIGGADDLPAMQTVAGVYSLSTDALMAIAARGAAK